jgi:hypothetical protein
MRLTTSPCKKKFVENLLRGKNARRGEGSVGCGATDDDDHHHHHSTVFPYTYIVWGMNNSQVGCHNLGA